MSEGQDAEEGTPEREIFTAVTDLYSDGIEPPLFKYCDDKTGNIYENAEFRAWIDYFFQVKPIALTMEQIKQYKPPKNPAKKTDVRFQKFSEEHGKSSWEVDALKPQVLDQIVRDGIEEIIDRDLYDSLLRTERLDREKLVNLKHDFEETENDGSIDDEDEDEPEDEDEDYDDDDD